MIVLACSATGGHVYPAIAINDFLADEKTCFVTDKGRISETIISSYNYSYVALDFRKNKGLALGISFLKMIRFFFKHKPKLVLGFGGITTIPVVIVARLFGVKTILFEQNALIGRTNKFLSYIADQLWLSYQPINTSNCNTKKLLGNPVRATYIENSSDTDIFSIPFKAKKKCLIFGGSQGALHLNRFIESMYPWFEANSIAIVHVLGDRDYKKKGYDADYRVIKNDQGDSIGVEARFIQDMKLAYSWADFVISRAGGTSIAELIYFKKPALLVPFKYATDNHQYYNAKVLSDVGMAMCVSEDDLSLSYVDAFFNKKFNCDTKKFEYFEGWKDALTQEI